MSSKKGKAPFSQEFPVENEINFIHSSMVPGKRYVFMLKALLPGAKESGVTRKVKEQMEADGIASKFSGEFIEVRTENLFHRQYAIFKDIHIYPPYKTSNYGGVVVPNFDFESIRKVSYDKSGNFKELIVPGNQYYSLKNLDSLIIGFNLSKYVFGEDLRFESESSRISLLKEKLGVNLPQISAFLGEKNAYRPYFTIREYTNELFKSKLIDDTERNNIIKHILRSTRPNEQQKIADTLHKLYSGDAQGAKDYLLGLLEKEKKSSGRNYNRNKSGTRSRSQSRSRSRNRNIKKATTQTRKTKKTKVPKGDIEDYPFTQAQLNQARDVLLEENPGVNHFSNEEIRQKAIMMLNNGELM